MNIGLIIGLGIFVMIIMITMMRKPKKVTCDCGLRLDVDCKEFGCERTTE